MGRVGNESQRYTTANEACWRLAVNRTERRKYSQRPGLVLLAMFVPDAPPRRRRVGRHRGARVASALFNLSGNLPPLHTPTIAVMEAFQYKSACASPGVVLLLVLLDSVTYAGTPYKCLEDYPSSFKPVKDCLYACVGQTTCLAGCCLTHGGLNR